MKANHQVIAIDNRNCYQEIVDKLILKKVKKNNTAGCYLVRKNKGPLTLLRTGTWEIILIYKKWVEDNQDWFPPKGHVEKGAIRETTE